MSVGRNELCPCGSGKKYKKCCGVVTPITELRSRHEQSSRRSTCGWVERLNHFVSGQVSSDAVQELRARFAAEVGLSGESVMSPEWTAHFFNWLVLDVKTNGDTPIENYLKQHGRRMEPDLRRAFSRLNLDVYEIVQVDRDALTVQHPLRGDVRYVIRTNTLQVEPGQLIAGRLLSLGLRDVLFTGSIVLQPHLKPAAAGVAQSPSRDFQSGRRQRRTHLHHCLLSLYRTVWRGRNSPERAGHGSARLSSSGYVPPAADD